MKLLIRDYLASLKERDELDAVLPDLLSELGFTVFSRPRRGTVQHGVDVAAVGKDEDGERKVFLFSVKQGDLTRQDWDGSPQALRPSLNEVRDAYIRNRIPARYRSLKIVICLTFGGDVREEVRDSLTGYIDDHTTDRISFAEWNGDKIADLIFRGILREEILKGKMRSSFRKAVAMIDEPDVALHHFTQLASDLRNAAAVSARARVRSARQLNICLWILFVWSRDLGNVEAPYRASEIALLSIWDLLRPTIGTNTREHKDLVGVLHQMIHLHLAIASELLERKVLPYVCVPHGLSWATGSQNALDVNLVLFELLGRIGLTGLWIHWLGERGLDQSIVQRETTKFAEAGLSLIENNPALRLPICDRQGTDVALFLQLCLAAGPEPARIVSWLEEMVGRLGFAIRTHGRYTTVFSDYRDLAEHPRDRSDAYLHEATSGSTLIPLIAAWLEALGSAEAVETLRELVQEKLDHCTLQLWTPDAHSEEELYVGQENHGRALCDLPLQDGGAALLGAISEACRTITGFEELSAFKTGFGIIVLLACRHHQLPVPPGFWIRHLLP
ncbi:MAG TPA: hypothetical protein VEY95_09530 [Azospirillaceae bacterium]|nr:hypothetical protein [Azospirillaceae bacterium]